MLWSVCSDEILIIFFSSTEIWPRTSWSWILVCACVCLGKILGTNTQCTVRVSGCFLVSVSRFSERGMMCRRIEAAGIYNLFWTERRGDESCSPTTGQLACLGAFFLTPLPILLTDCKLLSMSLINLLCGKQFFLQQSNKRHLQK